ncbi:hypothetical protein SKAU_G00206210 [Synaphobranchus kaupii]|uniref:Uncharacterized protein n=1 Tax=Synaphobranchus kaupii TaxID=118154 RepID=A0A9Q1FGR2_SYNKA|nr:hypothetical protein SKAU_G00206210 [Synaphobranchus kaupii]
MRQDRILKRGADSPLVLDTGNGRAIIPPLENPGYGSLLGNSAWLEYFCFVAALKQWAWLPPTTVSKSSGADHELQARLALSSLKLAQPRTEVDVNVERKRENR